ncbi:DUF1993 domain-containing protein [Psychrosphaera sp. B3R10]|uniref:DUF1993 family protein n=1 Tax=unclassified Psychrosphaera TaxID=2641570 RepID=UPI001C0837FA|nr:MULTISPECIES: DUF1993 family protein [unclassified Psychrosphaera]MBU2881185.1 DUF1993 domain-containing protein [Psychrosphaera sp. I2R16]MBU2988290.1 DUF1993 domain-containing protein [Psychrosphaera sp. B3R10]MDO6718499.1 DUF1993 family protein [Psychrosphaera sp. 1_MG-2023]
MDVKSILINVLVNLKSVVSKIPAPLFEQSLAPDMAPLGAQVQIAANFTLRGMLPLVGKPVADLALNGIGKQMCLEKIDHCMLALSVEELPLGWELQSDISEKAGFSEISLPPLDFVLKYILPNCYFHSSMAYAIARSHGVALSKGDFDGLHSYPVGFSFY